MTNEEVMQLMTDMGLHEGGIENWLIDNAWYLVVNKAIEKERKRILDVIGDNQCECRCSEVVRG
jgi:hypothetical protein